MSDVPIIERQGEIIRELEATITKLQAQIRELRSHTPRGLLNEIDRSALQEGVSDE